LAPWKDFPKPICGGQCSRQAGRLWAWFGTWPYRSSHSGSVEPSRGEPITLPPVGKVWQVPPDVPGSAIFDLYREEITRANAIIGRTPIDAMPKWWLDFLTNFPAWPLRKAHLHVIAETGVHAGHLDAARELIDGGQWLVLTQ
jgi:Protein of unknown function (DUF664)